MPNESQTMTRDDRRSQLRSMWHDRRQQSVVLGLFHRALPDNETPKAGMSMFDVILDSEYGESESQNAAEASE